MKFSIKKKKTTAPHSNFCCFWIKFSNKVFLLGELKIKRDVYLNEKT